MAELERVRSINPGVTLIEVMVAMVIFSAALGLATNLINEGLKTPFHTNPVENWLQLIDETGIAINKLTGESSTWVLQTDQPPFNQLTLPKNLKSWSIDKKPLTPTLAMVEFTALTHENKKIQWRFYKQEEK